MFGFEEKRQIKKEIDEPVEHVNMVDGSDDGDLHIESLLSKSEESSPKIINRRKVHEREESIPDS